MTFAPSVQLYVYLNATSSSLNLCFATHMYRQSTQELQVKRKVWTKDGYDQAVDAASVPSDVTATSISQNTVSTGIDALVFS